MTRGISYLLFTVLIAGSVLVSDAQTNALAKAQQVTGDRFEVTDLETGAIVTSGTMAEFHRGPAPRFVDAATGDVVVMSNSLMKPSVSCGA